MYLMYKLYWKISFFFLKFKEKLKLEGEFDFFVMVNGYVCFGEGLFIFGRFEEVRENLKIVLDFFKNYEG